MADSTANSSDFSRRRSWLLLGLVVAGHAALNVLLNPIGVPVSGTVDWLMLLLIGVVISQPVLFAGWAVMGPGSSIQRVPLTVAALATVVFAGYITAWNLLVSNWRDAELLIMSVSTFAVAATVMMLIRKLTRWRIVHLCETSNASAPANQFSLRFLLGLTAVCAVLLGSARSLASQQWLGLGASSAWHATLPGLLNAIGGALLVTFPAFTVPLIALSRRPTIQVLITVPLLWATLSWLAVETMVAIHPTEVRSEVAIEITFVQLGTAAAGLISAIALRFGRYRLVTLASSSRQSLTTTP